MLKNRIRIFGKILLRMVFTVIGATLILTTYSYVYSRLNYEYHFNDNWRYELAKRFGDIFQTIFFGLSILLSLYYLCILIFKNRLKDGKRRMLFLLSLSFIIFFLFMSTWGNPFSHLNFFEILLACMKMLLFGLVIFFVDYLTLKLLDNMPKNNTSHEKSI